jgi:hypothetical protein
MVELTSSGEAGEHQGDCLGRYDIVELPLKYRQRDTVSDTAYHLSR